MRDPRRIKRIGDLFAEWWRMNPDQRMGQLLSNLRGLGPQDIFYWEDDQLERALLRSLGRNESEAGPLHERRVGEAIPSTPRASSPAGDANDQSSPSLAAIATTEGAE